MIVTTEYVDIPLPSSPMRIFVAAPRAQGQFPGIWCYSDIGAADDGAIAIIKQHIVSLHCGKHTREKIIGYKVAESRIGAKN
jgi:hypothetical protein